MTAPATTDRYRPGLVRPATRLCGTLRLPSDKSIAHRALIFNALAEGQASVGVRHPGDDVLSTVACLRSLGVPITTRITNGAMQAEVTDGGEWRAPAVALDCGNSGTTLRLLAGAVAGMPLSLNLDGDASLQRRPMQRLAEPLRAMGAEVEPTGGHAPVHVAGRRPLRALEHRLPVASAQLLAAISLAGLSADGTTRIVSPGPTRDHTERLLGAMGVPIRREGDTTTLDGPARPRALSLEVPGDPSAAAAWLVAATLHPDAQLELIDVAINPTRLALIDALREMGADITVVQHGGDGPEPRGDVRVRSVGHVEPLRLAGPRVAALIDELPLLGVAMATATGVSELRGAEELRLKESDRIAATVAGLAAIGAQVEELPDGWRLRRGKPADALVRTHGDHRIAIAFAVAAAAGLAAGVRLDDPACVSVSYPTFWDDLTAVSA